MTLPLAAPFPTPRQPAKRPGKYLAHTKPAGITTAKTPARQTSRSQNVSAQIRTWYRITLYEVNASPRDTLRIGTLFSQDIKVLTDQLLKTIRIKWEVPPGGFINTDFQTRELRININPKKNLLVVFDAPNKQTHRAVSQHFARLSRIVCQELHVKESGENKTFAN